MFLASISIGLSGNIILFILFAVLFIIVSFLFYRYTLPPLPAGLRIILTFLRATVLILLVFILFQPVLRSIYFIHQSPTAVIFIDNSRSMTIHKENDDYKKLIELIKRKKIFEDISPDVEQKYYLFDSEVREINESEIPSISFNGNQTNIDLTLSKLKEYVTQQNVQAAFLISDGNYTAGKNPIHQVELLGIPLYTIGVGDTNEQKDVLIQKVLTNAIAYAENRVPVDVTITSSGINNQTVEISLVEDKSQIGKEYVKLNNQTRSYPVRFYLEPKREGVYKYTVRVSKVEGEITEKNNSSTFFIKVLKRKLNIFLFAGAPGPDLSAIRQIIESDQHYSIKPFIQKSSGEFYFAQLKETQIDSADCIILLGFPSRATNSETINLIKDWIERKKIPILFVNQRLTDYNKLRSLNSVLPFSWSGQSGNEMLVTPYIPEARKSHPFILLDGNINEESWVNLPPIYKSAMTFNLKVDAEILVSCRHQNIQLEEPLIALRNINNQKSIAITGYGIWRWCLLSQGSEDREQLLNRFLMGAVQWLTTTDSKDPVRLQTTKEIFTTAEPIEFVGQVYDERLLPVDDAEFSIEIQRGEEKILTELKNIGNGRYEGFISSIPEGDYNVKGRAAKMGRLFGEAETRFSVGEVNLEYLETRMNKTLLEQMADRTGGDFFHLSKIKELENKIKKEISFTEREINRTSEIELWNWKYLGGIIVMILAVEWLIRKRNGLI